MDNYGITLRMGSHWQMTTEYTRQKDNEKLMHLMQCMTKRLMQCVLLDQTLCMSVYVGMRLRARVRVSVHSVYMCVK